VNFFKLGRGEPSQYSSDVGHDRSPFQTFAWINTFA
jgi:hypothetical protein